jgi:hypothetical protein
MHRTQNLLVCAADTDGVIAVSPADILRGAARYLEVHGWTQGDYYDPRDRGVFPRACVTGAIGMAAYGRATSFPADADNEPGIRDYRKAVAYLGDYLDGLGITSTQPDDWSADPVNPIDWNDRGDQRAENVIAVLRDAADDYESTHGGTR